MADQILKSLKALHEHLNHTKQVDVVDQATIRTAHDEIERLREALTAISDDDNWFHTSDEPGGPYTAWRGDGEPDEVARKALNTAEAKGDG